MGDKDKAVTEPGNKPAASGSGESAGVDRGTGAPGEGDMGGPANSAHDAPSTKRVEMESGNGAPFWGSIRAKLVLLVLIAILPVSGLVVYGGLRLQKEQTTDAHEKALEMVRNLAMEHERTVASTRQLVMALSKLPEVQSRNRSACNALFAALLKQNNLYTNIIGIDPEGTLFASGVTSRPVYLGDRKHFQDAIRTRDFSPGEYIVGRTTNKPILSFSYPVTGSRGTIEGVVVASTDLDRYGQLLALRRLPEGCSFTITDHSGTMLFRYPQSDGLKGKADRPELMKRMRAGPEEHTLSVTRPSDGDKRIIAYKRFHLKEGAPPYLFMRVSLSETRALAGAKKDLIVNLAFLGIVFFSALMSALFMGNRDIVQRLRRLARASRELSKGNLQTRSGLAKKEDEIGVLSHAFDDMADKLERNELLRKEAEDAVFAQNFFLQNLINTIPNPVFYKDTAGIYRGCNRAFEDFVGLPREEIVGRTVFEVHAEEVAEKFFEHDTGLFNHGGTEIYDTVIRLRSGPTRDVIISKAVYTDSSGRISGLIGVMIDITDRKYAEARLKESQEALWSLINATKETLVLMDPEGKILTANETFAERLGRDAEGVVGLNLFDNLPAEVAEYRRAQTGRVVQTGKPACFDDRRGERLYRSYAYPVFDERGGVSKIAIFAADITERKRAEEERSKLQAQLRQSQKMEAIGTLAGGIAHDFNNILTALVGYGALLQMGLGKDNPLKMYADQILSSSEKAAQLTQSLLAFSRKQPITLKPLKLNDIVRGTEKLLKRLLTEDILFETRLTPDDTTILGDATQVDQILFNLVTNARDVMSRGGTLTIETRRALIDGGFVRAHGYGETGNYVVISVSDTGTGMDENTKDHIFDPFFTTKEVGKGTGLGLSTVYGIVKQHNGYINVESEINVGSAFHIYFPAVAAAVEEEESPAPQVKKGRETILVAEDNEAVRTLIRTILGKYGYTIIEAVDGEDAVNKFHGQRNVDLLIIDSVMPKKNGREVYDEICGTWPHVKALFMSGYTRDIVLDKGIEEKNFHFISKPLSPNDLLAKVREVLDGPSIV